VPRRQRLLIEKTLFKGTPLGFLWNGSILDGSGILSRPGYLVRPVPRIQDGHHAEPSNKLNFKRDPRPTTRFDGSFQERAEQSEGLFSRIGAYDSHGKTALRSSLPFKQDHDFIRGLKHKHFLLKRSLQVAAAGTVKFEVEIIIAPRFES
jgi:hypothetical protein